MAFKEQELIESMKNRINSCLKIINKKSFGPKGEIVNFEIFNSYSNRSKLTPNKINIVPGLSRQYSDIWGPDIMCNSIIHELLHLTGLVDEYQESEFGYFEEIIDGKTKLVIKSGSDKPIYNCRKTYDEDSIMKNSKTTFDKVYFDNFLIRHWCIANKSTLSILTNHKNKKNIREILYPKKCPLGFTLSAYQDSFPISDELVIDFKNNLQLKIPTTTALPKSLINKAIPIYTILPKQKSILKERHFNAIIFPGCYEKNRDYYLNSLNAYRSSKDHLGNGCLTFPQAQ